MAESLIPARWPIARTYDNSTCSNFPLCFGASWPIRYAQRIKGNDSGNFSSNRLQNHPNGGGCFFGYGPISLALPFNFACTNTFGKLTSTDGRSIVWIEIWKNIDDVTQSDCKHSKLKRWLLVRCCTWWSSMAPFYTFTLVFEKKKQIFFKRKLSSRRCKFCSPAWSYVIHSCPTCPQPSSFSMIACIAFIYPDARIISKLKWWYSLII